MSWERKREDGPEDPAGKVVFVSLAVLSEPDRLRIEAIVEVRGRRRGEGFPRARGGVVARVDRVDRVPHDRTSL